MVIAKRVRRAPGIWDWDGWMSGLSVDVNMVAWICWSGLPYMLHHVDSPILEYGRLDASHPHSSSQHSWDDLYLRFRRQVRIEHALSTPGTSFFVTGIRRHRYGTDGCGPRTLEVDFRMYAIRSISLGQL